MTKSEPRVYLLDVEGTVAPISLVAEQLFPYARKNLRSFFNGHLGEDAVQADMQLLREEHRSDAEVPDTGSDLENVEQAIAYLFWLMDRDRKSTALKSLQGKIWKAGFESGELIGTLFPDVPDAFERWDHTAKVAIYSSGSVEAQELLFRYSTYGDLTPWIAGYFDTRTGAKAESASYAAIASHFGVAANELLFFSDAVRELDAARAAGCATRLVMREGNAPVADAHGHAAIAALTGI